MRTGPLLNRLVVKNFLTLAALHAANYLLPLAITPYLVRVLQPQAFGELAFCQAIITYVSMFIDFGFGLSASRKIASANGDPGAISKVFWATLNAKALLLLVSFGFVAILVWLPALRPLMAVIAAASLVAVGTCIFPTWLFQGMQRMSVIAIANIIARIAVLPLIFVVVHSPSDIVSAAFVSSCGGLLAGVVGLGASHRLRVIGPFRFLWKDVSASLKEAWPLFLSSAGVSLYTAANLILLRFVASPTQVAYFAGADKIRTVAIGLIVVLTTAIFPAAVVSTQGDWPSLHAEFRYYWAKSALGIAIFAVLFFGARPIVHFILGDRMTESTQPLQILAFVGLIVPFNHVLGIHVLVARGYNKEFARCLLLAGAVNVFLLPILGSLGGARGAAFSPLVVEGVVLLSLLRARKRLMAQTVHQSRLSVGN